MRRGCIQDLDSDLMNHCLKQSATCKSCQGRFCNLKESFQECYTCNGYQYPDCSALPPSIKVVICDDYNSTCLTGIDRIGYTHRRCSNSNDYMKELTHFPNGLNICTENKCNNQIYPKDRLRCYHCSGEKHCNFIESHLTEKSLKHLQPKPCSLWSHQDQCYTYLNKGTLQVTRHLVFNESQK